MHNVTFLPRPSRPSREIYIYIYIYPAKEREDLLGSLFFPRFVAPHSCLRTDSAFAVRDKNYTMTWWYACVFLSLPDGISAVLTERLL